MITLATDLALGIIKKIQKELEVEQRRDGDPWSFAKAASVLNGWREQLEDVENEIWNAGDEARTVNDNLSDLCSVVADYLRGIRDEGEFATCARRRGRRSPAAIR